MIARGLRRGFALALVAVAWLPAGAEDVEKKFRLGFSIGGFNTTDEIPSDAANNLTLVNEERLVVNAFIDPRNDSAAFGRLGIDSGPIANVIGQYAISKIFLIEASVGYQKSDVGDVELQAQFDGCTFNPPLGISGICTIPDTQFFGFQVYRIPVGEIERIPIQFTALARFRPRSQFNPFVGAGIGYSFIGFEPSPEFNDLSRNLDASQGGQMRLTPAFNGVPQLIGGTSNTVDLSGARVDARDTFEYHVTGGAELSFKRKWAVFLDLRWVFASRDMSISFNGSNYLGVPVPQLIDFASSGLGNQIYGAVRITNGGLLDAGSLVWVPREGRPLDTVCVNPNTGNINTQECRQVFRLGELDGEPDRGQYYVQGGTIDYGGVSFTAGVRYTF